MKNDTFKWFKSIIDARTSNEITRKRFIIEWRNTQRALGITK